MKFITKSTKIQCIVASVLTALALITLIMLSSLLEVNQTTKLTISFIFTISLVLILLSWHGILQIKVFNDYKCKKNYLCADGILSLCMGALLIISGALFAILQLKYLNPSNGAINLGKSDIRIFLSCFLGVIACWKSVVAGISLKEKHFNWWLELLFTILWLTLTILCLITMFVSSITVLLWCIIIVSWVLIVITIFYMLFSYVIKTPTYLETPEAIKQYKEEIEAEKARKERIQNRTQIKNISTLQNKLKELKELKDSGLITEEEYKDKKAELLDSSF